jgi:hypothetical protein
MSVMKKIINGNIFIKERLMDAAISSMLSADVAWWFMKSCLIGADLKIIHMAEQYRIPEQGDGDKRLLGLPRKKKKF